MAHFQQSENSRSRAKYIRIFSPLFSNQTILPPTLPSTASCVSQRPQIVQEFPSDGTVGVLSGPMINIRHHASHNIYAAAVTCDPPPRSPRFLSLSTNEHLGHYLHIQVSGRYTLSYLTYVRVLSVNLETKGVSSFIYCVEMRGATACAPFTSWNLHNAASLDACFLICSECSSLSASLAYVTSRLQVGAKVGSRGATAPSWKPVLFDPH